MIPRHPQVAEAHSNLHKHNVYVEFLQNLAGSYPGHTTPNIPGSGSSDPSEGAEHRNGGGAKGGKLAADLIAHRTRIGDVLHRLPAQGARCGFN